MKSPHEMTPAEIRLAIKRTQEERSNNNNMDSGWSERIENDCTSRLMVYYLELCDRHGLLTD